MRVVALSQGVRSSFRELSTRLQQDYGFDVLLRYQDVDGDLIMLDSQNDLLELIGDNDARNDGPSIVVQVSRREDLSSKAKDTAKSECEGKLANIDNTQSTIAIFMPNAIECFIHEDTEP